MLEKINKGEDDNMLDFELLSELKMNKEEVINILERVGYDVIECEDTIFNTYTSALICGHKGVKEINEYLFINDNNEVISCLQF